MGKWWGSRTSPSAPIELFDITKDIDCEQDLASSHPEVVDAIAKAFKNSRSDSYWYRNPGEPHEVFAAKRQRAKDEGTLQMSTKANTVTPDGTTGK